MNKKRIFKIRWKFLSILIIVSVLPIIVVFYFSFSSIFDHLKKQNKMFYSRLLRIVSNNMDYTYENYGRTLVNIFNNSAIKKGISVGAYESVQHEKSITDSVSGNELQKGLRELVQERIEGAVFLYELDKKSLTNNTDYKIHYGLDTNYYISPPRFDKMIEDPLFKKIKNDNKIKLIFGKFKDGSIPGIDGNDKSVFIYPYYPEPPQTEKDTFNKFLVILINDDYIAKLYKDIDELNFGTLYILDHNNNIISCNHPSTNDFFEYDREKKEYVSTDPEDFDYIYNMSFNDYKKLNTDPEILKTSMVNNILSILTPGKIKKEREKQLESIFSKLYVIKYNNVDYLFVFDYSEITGLKFIYFQPLTNIIKPILNLIKIISLIAILIIILVVIISVLMSRSVTEPINKLADASLKIAKGNQRQLIDIRTNDEIGILCSNFNIMINNLNSYKMKVMEEETVILSTQDVTIKSLAKLAEYRDESTGKHLERVKEYVKLICSLLRTDPKYEKYLTDKYIIDVSNSSILHDIGKVGIESSVLLKQGKLTDDEFKVIKSHTIIGGDALSKADKELGMKSFLALAKEICYYHHEKYNGTGYPKGLVGEQIPLSARITALADVYDALSTDRCYRKALSHRTTMEIMIDGSVGHFDPDILNIFKEHNDKFLEIRELLVD